MRSQHCKFAAVFLVLVLLVGMCFVVSIAEEEVEITGIYKAEPGSDQEVFIEDNLELELDLDTEVFPEVLPDLLGEDILPIDEDISMDGEVIPSLNAVSGNTVTRDGFTVVDGVLTQWDKDPTVQTLIVPEDLGITSIGYSCFYEATGLQTVILPDSITSIGQSAFEGCTGLQQISLPKKLTEIGNHAFRKCVGLQSIVIPAKVVTIGASAFRYCSGLRKLKIMGKKLEMIDSYAFDSCSALKSVKLPDSVRCIRNGAFSGTWSMTSIDLGHGLTEIGGDAFFGSGIRSITIPGSLEEISGPVWFGVFEECNNLKTVVIENGVKRIGANAFKRCKSLQSVTIPSTVSVIGSGAFWYCSSLTELKIKGNGLKTIGQYAFCDCTSLVNVKLPDGILDIQRGAFSGDSKLEHIDLGTHLLYLNGLNGTGLVSISIPGTVKQISKSLFDDCRRLNSVILADGVTSIDDRAFFWCDSLENITIPNSVTNIGYWAFYCCASLKTITLPKSVSSIDSKVFDRCDSLTTVYVYENSFALDYCINNNLPYTILQETPVKSVRLDRKDLALEIGDSYMLVATVKPEDATDTGIIWSTSNSAIATVEDGLVTAVGKGTTTITCYSRADVNKRAMCKIKVSETIVPVSAITLSQSKMDLAIRKSATLKAYVFPSNATNRKVVWSTSDSAVATVKNGKITARGKGKAKITATCASNKSIKVTCTVTVADKPISEKRLNKQGSNGTVKLRLGKKLRLVPVFAAEKNWRVKGYKSTNKKVAKVSSSGLVKAAGKGTTTVSVMTDNGKKASIKIRVK